MNKKKKWRKERFREIFFIGIVLFIAFFALWEMEKLEVQQRRADVDKKVQEHASKVVYQVKNLYNNTFFLDIMLTENGGDMSSFYSVALDIKRMYSNVEFVALAPQGVISKVYQPNAYADLRNLDLLNCEYTEQACKRAKSMDVLNVSRPISCGTKSKDVLMGIQAVYLNNHNMGKKFWGYAIVGVKVSDIKKMLDANLADYAYELQTVDAEGKEKTRLLSKNMEQLSSPVCVEMEMAGQSWIVKVSPKGSWIRADYFFLRLLLIIVVCLIVITLMRFVRRDILRQMEMQAALEEEKERYQIAMESSSDTIFEYDVQEDRCVFFGSILNGKKTSDSKMVVENFEAKVLTGELFHYQDIERAIKFFSGEKTEPFETRYRLKTEDGQVKYVWLSLKGSVLIENGSPIKVIGTSRNIQARKEQEWKELEEGHKDKLTGLYTEACGRVMIEQYMTAKPKMEECEFFLIGIDHFQQINDVYGYMFADTILVEVAEIIRNISNNADICIRLGGDEFILFQKNTNSFKAERTAKEIIRRVRSVYAGENEEIQVSCSIGRASTSVFSNYEQMLKYAHLAFSYLKDTEKGKQANYINISDEIEEMLEQPDFNEREISEIIDTNPVQADDIISFAFGILEKTKDLKSAIYVLLARIGKRFDLLEVRVVELDTDYLSIQVNYRWVRREHYKEIETVTHMRNRDVISAAFRHFEKNGALEVTSSTIRRNSEDLSTLFQVVEEHSNLLCPMCEEGVYKGAIDFVAIDRKRKWTNEEKHIFKEVTKIISTHISRVNADIASKAKSEFLSRMSHEIRTPMNAIIGMTNIAMNSIESTPKVVECLEKIDVSTKYLLGLVNDILDMSRIESGKMTISNEKMNLDTIVEELEVLIRPQAEAKGIKFTMEVEYEHGAVYGDELRINQVLINLLGNALKFTPEGGDIRLEIREILMEEAIAVVYFAVCDTGIGISEENRIRIFEAFEQEQTDTANKYGGTGLGLAISNNLVHLMGGNLEVYSVEGEGATFSFSLTLPICQDGPMDEKETIEPVVLEQKKILVVEDNELNAEIAQTLLEMDGCQVRIACNGEEAVRVYKQEIDGFFDCILMDIRMPVMNGIDATRCIRTSEKKDARTIPIIALSANAFDEDTKKSIECGMNGHVAKPIDIDKLHEALYKVFQHK